LSPWTEDSSRTLAAQTSCDTLSTQSVILHIYVNILRHHPPGLQLKSLHYAYSVSFLKL